MRVPCPYIDFALLIDCRTLKLPLKSATGPCEKGAEEEKLATL